MATAPKRQRRSAPVEPLARRVAKNPQADSVTRALATYRDRITRGPLARKER